MEATGQVRTVRADQVHTPILSPLCEQDAIRFEVDYTELYFTEKQRCLPKFRARERVKPTLRCWVPMANAQSLRPQLAFPS